MAVVVALVATSLAPTGPALSLSPVARMEPRPTSMAAMLAGGHPVEVYPGPTETLDTVYLDEAGFSGPSPLGGPNPEPTDAPFGADIPVATNVNEQAAPSVAIAPDGTTIVVAYTNYTSPTNRDVCVARSTDGGQTWTHACPLANAGYNEWDPELITHGTRMFIFFSQNDAAGTRQMRWMVSTTNGASWTGQQVDFGSGGNFMRDFRLSKGMSNGQSMYVAQEITCDYAALCTPPYQMHMTHLFHADGSFWGPSIFFPFVDGASNPLPTLAPTIAANNQQVMWFSDTDGGASGIGCDAGDRELLTGRMPANTQQSGSTWGDLYIWGVCSTDSLRLDSAAHGHNITAVFQVIDPGIGFNDYAIVAFYNLNDGNPADFGYSAVALSAGVDYKTPAIYGSAPLYHTTFWAQTNLGYAFSVDGADTWDGPYKVNANTGTVVDVDRTTTVAYEGRLGVVWEDSRNGNNDIYFSTLANYAFYIFDRNPRQGSGLVIEGTPYTALPVAFLWNTGTTHNVQAPASDPVSPGVQLVFVDWDPDGDTNPTRDITVGATGMYYIANYATQYYLDISTSVAGGTTTPTSGWFDASTPVDIYCNLPPSGADVRYSNPTWTGMGPGSYTGPASNPDTILMGGPITEVCDATTEYRHTYDTLPTGLNIAVDGTTYAAPQTFWWASGTSHTVLCITPQTAGSQRYTFNRWSDGSVTNPRTFAGISAAGTFVCEYTSEYQWTFNSSPAACEYLVDSVPYTGTQQLWLAQGSNPLVDMTEPQAVSPNQRYMFGSWSDLGAKSHTIGPINSAGSLTLTCTSQYRYVFDSTPTGLNILVDGSTVPTPTSPYWWNEGTSHTVEFTTMPLTTNSRRAFLQWGDGSPANPRTFVSGTTTPGSHMIQTVIEYRYNFQTNPAGLDVVVGGSTFTSPHEEWWQDGTSHTAGFNNIVLADTRQVFAQWQDGNTNNPRTFTSGTAPGDYTIIVNAEYRYNFNTSPTGLELTIDGSPVTAPSGDLWWVSGSTHTVEFATQPAGADSRYVFDSWTDGDLNNPRTFTSGTTPAGNYFVDTALEYQYVFTTSPAGLTVYVDTVSCATPCTEWWLAGSSHSVEFRPMTVTTGTQRVFSQWADGGSVNPRPFNNIAAGGAYTVNTKLQHELTVTSAHGTVTGADWYDEGTQATVTLDQQYVAGATGERFRFDGWTGDASGTSLSVTVTMNAPKAVTATWVTQYELTVTSAHGTVTGADWYDTGESATLTLDARIAPGTGGVQYRFNRWTGDASGTDLTSSSITMNAPKAVVAEWVTQYAITVETSPQLSGLQAKIVIGGTSYDMQAGVYYVDSGTSYEVRVPAEVSSGGKTYKFVSWDSSTGTATAARTHTATFREVGLFESPIVLIGIIVIVLVVVLLIVLLLLRRRKKPEEKAEPAAGAPGESEVAMMTCPSCGKSIPSVAGPCPECGAEIALE